MGICEGVRIIGGFHGYWFDVMTQLRRSKPSLLYILRSYYNTPYLAHSKYLDSLKKILPYYEEQLIQASSNNGIFPTVSCVAFALAISFKFLSTGAGTCFGMCKIIIEAEFLVCSLAQIST